jgi:hypothetical protein
MKIRKTLKQTYLLMKHHYVEINQKYYEISYIYSLFMFFIQYILIFTYLFVFIFIVARLVDYSNIIVILGSILGLIGMYVAWECIEFTLTYFAPLKEVEKPKEEVKKAGFLDRYKLYKAKQKHQLEEEGK